MIENFITQEKILQGEPHLDSYLAIENQLDFTDITDEAFDEYLNDVKNQKVDLRKLGKRLSLQISVTKTAAFDGIISEVDNVERRRLVIEVVALTGDAVFSLQGSNDETTFSDVKTDIQFNITGNHIYLFSSIYKFYRLRLISIGITITYSAYLYETTFDFPLLYLMRAKIYHSIYHRNGDDAFKEKSDTYQAKYVEKLVNTHYFYDESDDEEISEDETEDDLGEVVFRP